MRPTDNQRPRPGRRTVGLAPLVLLAWLLAASVVVPPVASTWAQASDEYKVQAVLTGEVVGRFEQPLGLFFNPNNQQILVGDSGKRRLVEFRETEGVLTVSKEIPLKEAAGYPIHFVQTSEGRIILSDRLEHRVVVLYPSGALAGPFDLSKVPANGSILPGDLALDRSGQLYLVDETNRRILVFDEKGRYQRAIKPDDPTLRGINAVAVDAKSNVYALDTLGGRVYQFSPTGKMLTAFGQRGPAVDQFDFPVDLAVDRQGFVYVVDQHRGTIVVFNSQFRYQVNIASRGWEKGQLLFPTAVVVDDKDRVFVVDRNNRRVQIYSRKEKTSS